MARVLLIPCGERERALAAILRERGLALRGVTSDAGETAAIAAVGAEPYVGDPDRIGTLMDALAGVSVVCWLFGDPAASRELHDGRLWMLWSKLVDTPVRGVVYEPASGDAETGLAVARDCAATWRIPLELLPAGADPRRAGWADAAAAAVGRLLGLA